MRIIIGAMPVPGLAHFSRNQFSDRLPVFFPCIWYLKRQLSQIRPVVVCSLGSVATAALLERQVRITATRGQRFHRPDYILIPTYHPAFLLRNPSAKKEAWHDLKLIRALLDDLS